MQVPGFVFSSKNAPKEQLRTLKKKKKKRKETPTCLLLFMFIHPKFNLVSLHSLNSSKTVIQKKSECIFSFIRYLKKVFV